MDQQQASISAPTFTHQSVAKLKTGFFTGFIGQLGLDDQRNLIYTTSNPKDSAHNFHVNLDEVSLIDFTNAMGGHFFIHTSDGKIYHIFTIAQASPKQLIKGVAAVGAGTTIARAEEWEQTLIPLLGPDKIELNHGSVKRIFIGTVFVVSIAMIAIFVALYIGTGGHVFTN